MKNSTKSIRFLDANMLRALACALMLCDHMWATIVPGNEWMTWLGRLAVSDLCLSDRGRLLPYIQRPQLRGEAADLRTGL